MDTIQNAEIKISPELIKMLGKSLYSNSNTFILVRELLQNSRDATLNGGRIEFELAECGSEIAVKCSDTGVGMDEETLLNVFLTIGKSKKSSEMAVGGFGIAKVALFATNSWAVHTRNNFVSSDMHFEHRKSRKGTEIGALVAPRHGSEVSRAELILRSNNVNNLWLNGEKVRAYKTRRLLSIFDTPAGEVRVGTAPAINGYKNLVFYRIRGLTQYYETLGYDDDFGFNIVVDFDNIGYRPGSDNYPFSLSREGCSQTITQAVKNVVAPLVKNKRTAARKYAGPKEPRERVRNNKATGKISVDTPKAPAEARLVYRQIENLWGEILKVMGYDDVGTGMVFTEGVGAQHRWENGKEFILLNPQSIVEAWVFGYDVVALPMYLWHLACHELAHVKFSDHDEDFTSEEQHIGFVTAVKIANALPKLRYVARKPMSGILALRGESR